MQIINRRIEKISNRRFCVIKFQQPQPQDDEVLLQQQLIRTIKIIIQRQLLLPQSPKHIQDTSFRKKILSNSCQHPQPLSQCVGILQPPERSAPPEQQQLMIIRSIIIQRQLFPPHPPKHPMFSAPPDEFLYSELFVRGMF